jgi:diguanylate cyclase (GGDEF)-like protein
MALHRAQRCGKKAAVMFLDLDGFKAVNDRHGHAAGNHVLKVVAGVIQAAVRESDTASRAGGDEFLIILDLVADDESASRVARRILGDLKRAIPFQDALLSVGASIGIATFPDDGGCVDSLLEAADSAMYQVKRRGKGGFLLAGGDLVGRAEWAATGTTSEVRQLQFQQLHGDTTGQSGAVRTGRL